MSFKTSVSLVTIILLIAVIFFGWAEIQEAFGLLGRVNPFILLLILPVQLISFYGNGNTVFSYLKAKGDIKDLSKMKALRMALEFNFVNHVIPSGGVSGFSYMGWQLGKYGVSAGRSTMAQMIRLVVYFLAYILILIFSVMLLALDHGVNRVVLLFSIFLIIATIVGLFLTVIVIEKRQFLVNFSKWLVKNVNRLFRIVTFGKKRKLLDYEKTENFFLELHHDYLSIKRDKKILFKPFLWSMLENVTDVGVISIAFLSLGYVVSPAVMFISFGLAAIASAISVTPGGAGMYEAAMVGFMVSSGLNASVAVAGTLLARVVLLLFTLGIGFIFYQMTIIKYGKKATEAAAGFTKKDE